MEREGSKRADEDGQRFFYNKIKIKITKRDETYISNDFFEGHYRGLLVMFQAKVVEVVNRLIRYFKHEKRHPNLREISFVDLLNQEE